MNKYNTLLGQLLSFVPRSQFEKLVKITQADKHCKGFTTWQQFAAMSYAQLASPNGLRSLEKSLNSNRTCLYHLGIHKDLKRSTISYANNNRSCELSDAFSSARICSNGLQEVLLKDSLSPIVFSWS